MKFICGKQFRANDHHGLVYSSLSDPPNFGVLSRWVQALWQQQQLESCTLGLKLFLDGWRNIYF